MMPNDSFVQVSGEPLSERSVDLLSDAGLALGPARASSEEAAVNCGTRVTSAATTDQARGSGDSTKCRAPRKQPLQTQSPPSLTSISANSVSKNACPKTTSSNQQVNTLSEPPATAAAKSSPSLPVKKRSRPRRRRGLSQLGSISEATPKRHLIPRSRIFYASTFCRRPGLPRRHVLNQLWDQCRKGGATPHARTKVVVSLSSNSTQRCNGAERCDSATSHASVAAFHGCSTTVPGNDVRGACAGSRPCTSNCSSSDSRSGSNFNSGGRRLIRTIFCSHSLAAKSGFKAKPTKKKVTLRRLSRSDSAASTGSTASESGKSIGKSIGKRGTHLKRHTRLSIPAPLRPAIPHFAELLQRFGRCPFGSFLRSSCPVAPTDGVAQAMAINGPAPCQQQLEQKVAEVPPNASVDGDGEDQTGSARTCCAASGTALDDSQAARTPTEHMAPIDSSGSQIEDSPDVLTCNMSIGSILGSQEQSQQPEKVGSTAPVSATPKATREKTLAKFPIIIRRGIVEVKNVVKFVRRVVSYLVPVNLWGSLANRRTFFRHLGHFISGGRYEQILLRDVMKGISYEDCIGCFLKAPAATPAERSRAPDIEQQPLMNLNNQQQQSLTRRVDQWFLWLWSMLIVPLLRANFYVTEVDGCANKVRFSPTTPCFVLRI